MIFVNKFFKVNYKVFYFFIDGVSKCMWEWFCEFEDEFV